MDFKRKSNVSRALWVPLIWIMIIGSRPVAQWLNLGTGIESPESYFEGNPVDRTVLLILMIAGLFLLFKRNIYWSKTLKNNVWLVLFFLYAGISVLWSDFPGVAFRRWIKTTGDFIMVLIVLTESDPIEAVKTLIKRCAYVLIPLSVVFIKYYPDLGIQYDFWTGMRFYKGVSYNKNGLGNTCLICGFIFFWNLVTMWRKNNVFIKKKEILVHILFLLMTFWLLIKADSATSLACMLIGILIILGVGLPIIRRNVRYMGTFIFFIVVVFFILQLSFDIKGVLISNLGRDPTLTGRTEIWKALLDMKTNPLIGTGYESFWLGERLRKSWETFVFGINQAHNGYLEIYLNLGLIGLFLLISIIVSVYKKIYNTFIIDFDYGRFRLSFLIIFLLYNVTEATFKGLSIMWFIFLLIALDVKRVPQFTRSN